MVTKKGKMELFKANVESRNNQNLVKTGEEHKLLIQEQSV